MPSFNIRAKLLLLICAPLLFYIFSLWGCLEFWIIPKAIEKLAEDRADTVSESVENYIQAYLGNPEEILEANKNAIALSPISKFLGELESSNNNQNQIFYAKIFIIDSCGGIIATSNKDEPLPRQDNSQIKSKNNNKKCNEELTNIEESKQNLIKEILENLQFSKQKKIEPTDIKTENIVGQVTRLNYSPQQKWLTIVAISRESIGKEITPRIVLVKFLCILLAIVVGIIFWVFVARPIINSIKSLTNREQNMEQKLEQQQLELKSNPSIKQELEQLKQETDIHKKAERVMQIIERHELQQLINKKKIEISNQLKKNG